MHWNPYVHTTLDSLTVSGRREVGSYVSVSSDSLLNRIRSIAIDYLIERSRNENFKVVYVYYEYKQQKVQTNIHIVRNLLRQLISQLTAIPEEIGDLYDEFTKTGVNHDLIQTLTEHLLSQFQTYRTIAVFDALDECNSDQIKYLLELFRGMPRGSSRILASSRPHSTFLYDLSDPDVRRINIVADESDLKNFVMVKLNDAGETYEPLRTRCFELIKGVQGMYSSQ